MVSIPAQRNDEFPSQTGTLKMLSNPLQRFSPYQTLPQPGMMSNGHVPQQDSMHSHGLSPLGQQQQYGMQQMHQNVNPQSPQLARATSNGSKRQQPYGASGRVTSTNGQVRRRISRACDQCNQLRTKCDGQHPCAHCIGMRSILRMLLPPAHFSRIRSRLRICSRAQETRQSLTQGSRCTCFCGRRQWTEVRQSW